MSAEESTTAAPEQAPAPVVRIVSGSPTPEEAAVVTLLLSAAGGGGDEAPAGQHSQWADHTRLVRHPMTHTVGGWRASGLPR